MKKKVLNSISIMMVIMMLVTSLPINVFAANVPARPSITSVYCTQTTASVYWTESKGATSYKLQYSTSSKFDEKHTKGVTVKGGSTTKYKITNLKRGTKYYFRIKAYKKVSGKPSYSGWSSGKSKTTLKKYSPSRPAISSTGSTTNTVTVKWSAPNNWHKPKKYKSYSRHYIVQISEDKTFKDKSKTTKVKVKYTTKSYTFKKLENDEKLKKDTKYYVRVIAYNRINDKNKYSNYSKVVFVKTKAKSSTTTTTTAKPSTKPSTTYAKNDKYPEYQKLLKETYKSMHITKDMSDLQKSLIIGKWITANVKYDKQYKDSTCIKFDGYKIQKTFTPYGALKDKHAVCQGYTCLFYDFCQLANIECVKILGHVNSKNSVDDVNSDTYINHMWLAIKIDGYWYQIEPQSYGSFLNKHQYGDGCSESNRNKFGKVEGNFDSDIGLYTGIDNDTPGTMDEASKKIWKEECKPHGTEKTRHALWGTYSPLAYDLLHWHYY